MTTDGPAGKAARAPAPGRHLHASALAWRGRGLLLIGTAGAGKSDLACRLIEAGGHLVADDLVRLERRGEAVMALRPERASNAHGTLIELRGQGVYAVPGIAETRLDLVVELVPAADQERLPPERTRTLLGCALKLVRLDPQAASALARLAILLQHPRAA
ncbi:MAG: serine/threonine protein kinase [Geminicoccaceae bacterium]|nr:serine/threonine protein kinase [Geminicoccaceae bacterium]